MAGYVCTVAGGKGGVGKTTTAVNVSAALQQRGHDVVVVDADLGMANLGELVGAEDGHSVHQVLADEATVEETLVDVDEGLTVLPGEQSLDAFAGADPSGLTDVLGRLRERYDVVVVDTGSGVSHEMAVPLGLADGVVLVTTPEAVAVTDAGKTADLVGRLGGTVLGVVTLRATGDTDLAGIGSQLGVPVLGAVPDDPATGDEPVVVETPEEDVSAAYRALAEQLSRVLFEGVDPADTETAVEEAWFRSDTESATEDSEDDEDSGGRFGGLFS
ncbi:MAG: septum site-determining protein MinD [Natronomonas sp.]|jgi:septum site-determining protein MinD